MPDVDLPPSLSKLPKIFYTMDPDCYDRLTKLLSSGSVQYLHKRLNNVLEVTLHCLLNSTMSLMLLAKQT